MDIQQRCKEAFEGDDVARKNIALRKAHDEIGLLREALCKYGNTLRMGWSVDPRLQQTIDDAFANRPTNKTDITPVRTAPVRR